MIEPPEMPPRPPEKVLLCSASGLRSLESRLPRPTIEASHALGTLRVVVRQDLPDNFVALIDAQLLVADEFDTRE